MRARDRRNYLKRSGKLAPDILLRGRYHFTYDLMPAQSLHMPVGKRLNLLKTGANLIHRRTHPWGWPVFIHVELVNYCNLKCTVCPTGIGGLGRRPAAIDPALFERLMDEIGPRLLTASLWGWGEPLLHPELADILRIAHSRGITTFISTNGQNLDSESVQQALIEYPPNYLIVALDGLTDETLSLFRTGARLDPALFGLRRLAEMKRQKGSRLPVLHLRFIVMRHNEHEVPHVAKFAEDSGFDELTIRTLAIIDAPDDAHRKLVPEGEEYRAYEYANGERVSRSDFTCERPFVSPAVFADGTVVACDQDFNAQQPYGSIADGSSFADLWWSRRAAEVRRTIRDNPESFSFCRNCPFKDRPVGDCSAWYVDVRP